MSRRSRRITRTAAALASLMIAVTAVPGVAAARPAADGAGPRAEQFANPPADTVAKNRVLPGPPSWPVNPQPIPSEPAPTVVRTVVKEDAVRVLPIALAGAALLIAVGGMSYLLMRVAPRQRLGGLH